MSSNRDFSLTSKVTRDVAEQAAKWDPVQRFLYRALRNQLKSELLDEIDAAGRPRTGLRPAIAYANATMRCELQLDGHAITVIIFLVQFGGDLHPDGGDGYAALAHGVPYETDGCAMIVFDGDDYRVRHISGEPFQAPWDDCCSKLPQERARSSVNAALSVRSNGFRTVRHNVNSDAVVDRDRISIFEIWRSINAIYNGLDRDGHVSRSQIFRDCFGGGGLAIQSKYVGSYMSDARFGVCDGGDKVYHFKSLGGIEQRSVLDEISANSLFSEPSSVESVGKYVPILYRAGAPKK